MHPPPGRGKTAVPPCPLSRYSPAPALAGQDLANGEDRNVAGERTALGKAGLMAAFLLAPTLAGAQPASDYQLPPASPSPAPRAAGPVEEGAPAPTVAASPSAAPTPAPPPQIAIPTPTVAPAKPTPRPRAIPRAPDTAAAPAPGPSPTPVAGPSPDVAPPAATVPPTPEPSVAPMSDTPPVNTTDAGEDWRPLAAGIAVAVAAIIAALLFWRRRRAVIVPTIVVPEPEPAPGPTPAPTPAPRAEPAPAPAPAPVPPAPIPLRQPVADPLELRLEATRMSATLVNTTLTYRLVALNRGTEPLTDIAINGDMTAAHASKPIDEQLGLAGPDLPPIHHIDRLEPGAELALPGEMRLPLTAVTPIRAGEAALFVPLARFDAWASTPAGGAIHARAAYMVGQESTPTADRLQPFRLDLGPRTWADLGQRALALPVS